MDLKRALVVTMLAPWVPVCGGCSREPKPEPIVPTSTEVIDTGVVIDTSIVDTGGKAFVPDPIPLPGKQPPDAGAEVGCAALCRIASRECDKECGYEAKGCLRKCGCALETCEGSCAKSGTFDFGCH